ncbi:hypothetical protein [Sphingomonas sp.]|uniref:hypothetical protein n=1 Tax=Sphingomonas sp. TaxID=28214 RepID=UPI00386B13FA
MARLTSASTAAVVLAKCHAAQIPAQPVSHTGDILEETHLAATEIFPAPPSPDRRKLFRNGAAGGLQRRRFCRGRLSPRLGEHGKAANGWAKAWMRNTDAKLTLADLVTRPPTWHDRPRVFQLPATAPT